ncbi:MAG: rane protein [Sporomusa sp.]|nr:rane protein [Sporomusa sp.]
MKAFIIIGAINAFIAVALGAFGAHGLADKLEPKYLDIWKTGVTYQMFHATGILVIGLLLSKVTTSPQFTWAGWLMLLGIILFSGSLYTLSLTKVGILGAITPLGGVCFLAAWVLIIIGAVKYL